MCLFYICMYVHKRTAPVIVCVCVCVCVFMNVYMYVKSKNDSARDCVCVYIYVCIYVCKNRDCVYLDEMTKVVVLGLHTPYIHTYIHTYIQRLYARTPCMCVYVNIHTHTSIHTHVPGSSFSGAPPESFTARANSTQ